MFVSGPRGQFERVDKECRFGHNGSFIDIWYDDGGRQRWLAVEIASLRSFLGDLGSAKEATGLVCFDEYANVETALADLISHNLVAEACRERQLRSVVPSDD